MRKVCKDCNLSKHVDDFYLENKATGRRRNQCKDCRRAAHAKYSRERWYPANKDRQQESSRKWKLANKDKVLSARYKIPLSEIQRLLDNKPDCCEICQNNTELVFDHCHVDGQFRGWLCNECNTLIGKLGDNLSSVKRYCDLIVSYLSKP